MKKNSLFFLLLLLLLSGCNKDSEIYSTEFELTINSVIVTFKISEAYLFDEPIHHKRMVFIEGISKDKSKRVNFLVQQDPSVKNGVTAGIYALRVGQPDDPATALDESKNSDEANIGYLVKDNSNNWSAAFYTQKGSIMITDCNTNIRSISGKIEVQLTNFNNPSDVIDIWNGSFNNIAYEIRK